MPAPEAPHAVSIAHIPADDHSCYEILPERKRHPFSRFFEPRTVRFQFPSQFLSLSHRFEQVTETADPFTDHCHDQVRRCAHERGAQPLLRAGKLSGLSLTVSQTGVAVAMIPFIGPDLRGSAMLSSVPLTSFTVQGGRVTGQGSRALSDTMGQGWSYSAGWNATLRPPAR